MAIKLGKHQRRIQWKQHAQIVHVQSSAIYSCCTYCSINNFIGSNRCCHPVSSRRYRLFVALDCKAHHMGYYHHRLDMFGRWSNSTLWRRASRMSAYNHRWIDCILPRYIIRMGKQMRWSRLWIFQRTELMGILSVSLDRILIDIINHSSYSYCHRCCSCCAGTPVLIRILDCWNSHHTKVQYQTSVSFLS